VSNKKRLIILASVLIVIVASIVFIEVRRTPSSKATSPQDQSVQRLREITSPAKTAKGPPAPELAGISGWINSEPFTLNSLQGKVVLIDFWTYTCVNCVRTLPYLKMWYEKYSDKGLVIIGVHSPEFSFEKKRENVVQAVQKFGLKYPIVMDNDHETWDAFGSRAWPNKYLIDKDGLIRFNHIGEGAYDETERKIQELLSEAGSDVSRLVISADSGLKPHYRAFGDLATGLTRELYAGVERNYAPFPYGEYVDHEEYYKGPDREVVYADPGNHKNHYLYLQGPWINGVQSLRHARKTENFEDYIAILFNATSVNAVINWEGPDPFLVRVTLDGEDLSGANKGEDIIIDGGRSYVRVDEPRMYNLVRLKEFEGHELRLSSNSDLFSLYAFTFGAYEEGP